MIDVITSTVVCGFVFIPCIHRQLTTNTQTEQQQLCSTFKEKPDWCSSKIEPIYPTIKRDTSQ
jgi:predicted nucleotide-binding protein (sugar kinase/HSP70/actin superfamily)